VTAVSGGLSATVTTDEWVRDADLGVARSVAVLVATQTVTYDPPLAQASFPLNVGKSWTVQTAVHVAWGFIDTTITVTGDAAVLSEGPLTVPAGSYTAVAIRHNRALNQLGASYSVQYYTEATGNWVKRETYGANDQRVGEEVLTAYRCQACVSPTLVIVGIAVVAAVAIVGLFLLRRRRSPGGSDPTGTSPPR